jgi:hypothetical protein
MVLARAIVVAWIASTFLPAVALAQTRSGGVVTPAQLRQVKALPVPVYLPKALPGGFHTVALSVYDFSRAKTPYGWGYELSAAAGGSSLNILVATSGFGGGEADYKGFRRPFTVSSAQLGVAHFTPAADEKKGWCYVALTNVPHALEPPVGSAPSMQISACGLERPAVERLYQSLQLVKAQTAYPKS